MQNRIEWEIKENVRFSKMGIVQFINDSYERENPETDELWQKKIKTPSITYYMKKGGSHLHAKMPFLRFEMIFPKAFKIHKLMKVVSFQNSISLILF